MKPVRPPKTTKRNQYLISLVSIFLVASICFLASHVIGYRVVALILLMTVSIIAMLFDIAPVLTAAVISAIVWNFFFIPPVFTFHIGNTEDVLMFLLYFFIALVNGVLSSKIREAEGKARDKEEKENTINLYNTLLNSLSHELKTPIATILGAVDTIKENNKKLSEENQHLLLSEIDKAAIRLNRQVENLLNMSRLDSGTLQPKRDWCDLTEICFSVIQKLPPGHTQKIMFHPVENLPLIKSDAVLLEQIMYNLLHNAIQYTPDHAIIELSCLVNASTCLITVTDNGEGFPEKEIHWAFEKFYRLPSSKAGGSGLGLSIVKGFVEALHGKITLQNIEPHGARFTIEIPSETSYINHLNNE